MSNAEFPNYYPYINSSNEDFFREVEKYLDNATPQNKGDLPPQAIPELTIDQYSNEIDSQQELRDPIIFGLMGIIKVNKSNEENINKRTPLNRMDKKTLKIIKKVNISAQALIDKKLDDLK